MVLAALIGLEERERIDALRDHGRMLMFADLIRGAVWGKDGLKADSQRHEESLTLVPGDAGPPGELSAKERELAAYIFSSGLFKLPTPQES